MAVSLLLERRGFCAFGSINISHLTARGRPPGRAGFLFSLLNAGSAGIPACCFETDKLN
jgi:hypothetical protein